jgi:magnesium chelatase family protein
MFVRTYGAAIRGVDVLPVSVELRSGRGIQFHVAGMSGSLAKDAFLRIRGALQAEGWSWPRESLTISLSPAHGSLHPSDLDLPLALAVLAQLKVITPECIARVCSAGSLGLDGELRAHPSAANALFAAEKAACTTTFVPQGILGASAGSQAGVSVFGAKSLREVVNHLNGTRLLPRWIARNETRLQHPLVSLEAIRTNVHLTRGLILAATGEHHVLLLGSPGTGKTLAAKVLHGLLPALTSSESHELRRLHACQGLIRTHPLDPPLRTPHSGSGAAALIGSRAVGRNAYQGPTAFLPGELSLAHRGMLLLDELPEWSRPAIEALRGPLETGFIDLARAGGTVRLPAKPLVAATANPCPCGYFMDARRKCRCTPSQVRGYIKRLSGPLIDRFPIHFEMTAHEEAKEDDSIWALTTEEARRWVLQARRSLNSCSFKWSEDALECLEVGTQRWRLSLRAQDAVQLVSKSHAALMEKTEVQAEDVQVAFAYRIFDRADWLDGAWDRSIPQHRG